jgi:hypothetical protein
VAMPTTIAVSPSPQGHEQRRVSSPPQAKFGRDQAQQKILSVVLAQHHSSAKLLFPIPPISHTTRAPCRSVIFAFGHADKERSPSREASS